MKDGQRWEIPADLYRPLEQGVVILKSSANQNAAQAFLKYLRTAEAQALLARYGFTTPPVDASTSHHP
jgi:molybdate transport system substrate-binding protein